MGDYKHLIPVTIRDQVVKAMIDSGNLWRNAMSEELMLQLGLSHKDLRPIQGFQTIGTAKEDARLMVLGEFKRPLRVRLGGMGATYNIRPIVLRGLRMGLNIGGPFLREHAMDQLHSENVLRIATRKGHQKIPLLSEDDWSKSPDECTISAMYVDKHYVVPPNSRMTMAVRVPEVQGRRMAPGAGIVHGSPTFVEKTDLHPWAGQAVTGCPANGLMKVQVMNTSDEPCVVRRGTYMGEFEAVDLEATKTINNLDMAEEATAPKHIDIQDEETRRKVAQIIEVFQLDDSDLLAQQPDQKAALILLLLRNYDLFSWDGEVGRTHLIEHQIETQPDARPVYARYKPLNPVLEADLKKQVDKWLAGGVIEPTTSPWNSRLVAVVKKSGAIRWCVDFRALNDVTIKDRHPLGHIEDNLGRLVHSTVFSTIDGAGAFNAIPVKEADRYKTAFSTPWGVFAFSTMPFGLCNAPATYARLVTKVLEGIPYEVALPYLDDTLVHSRDGPQHLSNLQKVFDANREAGLKLQPEKCKFFREEAEYLGHLVSRRGIRPLPEYVEIVQDWPLPTTRTATRTFLGKTGYYRRFIRDYQKIAKPLTDKLIIDGLGDEEPFEPSEAFKAAFNLLRQRLLSAPILAYPDFHSNEPFILDTDWSHEAATIGGVLSQKQQGVERVIAYGAKKLPKHRRNYSSHKGELYAALTFMRHWSYYLYFRPFVLRTDHAALKWLRTMEPPTSMALRWMEALANFDFVVQHRPGKAHGNCDALSRTGHAKQDERDDREEDSRLIGAMAPLESEGEEEDLRALSPLSEPKSKGCPTCHGVFKSPRHSADPSESSGDLAHRVIASLVEATGKWSQVDWHQAQMNDPDLLPLIDWLSRGEKPTPKELEAASATTVGYAGYWSNLRIEPRSKLLQYKKPMPAGIGEKWLTLAPRQMWEAIIWKAHEAVAHARAARTTARIQNSVYFSRMLDRTAQVLRGCRQCNAKAKAPQPQRHTLVSHVDGYPMKKLAIDFVGPMQKSKQGRTYLFTVRDCFTRWLEAFPCRRCDAETAVKLLVKEIFCRYGPAEQLHADNGSSFIAELTREVARRLDITTTNTPTYNPRSNPVERAHRDLGAMLTKLAGDQPSSWEEHVPHAVFAINTSVCETTGLAPYLLMFGRDTTANLELLFGAPPAHDEKYKSPNEYAEILRTRIQAAFKWAREHIAAAVSRRRKAYYKDRVVYNLGDQVWLFTPRSTPGVTRKFATYWTGPWTVTEHVNSVLYRVAPDTAWERKSDEVVAVDRLRLFVAGPDGQLPAAVEPPADADLRMVGDEHAESIDTSADNDEDYIIRIPRGIPTAAEPGPSPDPLPARVSPGPADQPGQLPVYLPQARDEPPSAKRPRWDAAAFHDPDSPVTHRRHTPSPQAQLLAPPPPMPSPDTGAEAPSHKGGARSSRLQRLLGEASEFTGRTFDTTPSPRHTRSSGRLRDQALPVPPGQNRPPPSTATHSAGHEDVQGSLPGGEIPATAAQDPRRLPRPPPVVRFVPDTVPEPMSDP